MDKFKLLVEEAMEPKKLSELFPVEPGKDEAIYEMAEDIAGSWLRELTQKYSVLDISPKDVDFATKTFNAWIQDKQIDRPVVVAAPPAFGKSVMLSMFLRTMTHNFPETFGAVVVKERLEDLEELRDEINEYCGKERAFLIRGRDKDIMSDYEYEEQFHKQRKYNVLLMTTKQLERQSMRENLESFTSFESDCQRKQRRSLLLIDEKPSLVLSHKLDIRELNDFISDIIAVNRDSEGKVKTYYNRVKQEIDKLRKVLEDPETPEGELEPLNQGYRLPGHLVTDIADNYGHDEMKTLRAVEQIISAGGVFSNGIITSTHKVHYEYSIFHTYILDGTGAGDPEYLADDFYVVQPEETFNYSNVLFRECNTYSLSKTSLSQSSQHLEQIIKMIKRIIEEHEGEKTLVVTYKDYVKGIEEALRDELDAGKAMIKHFDGGRGSNAYTECNNAIYIGTLFKGTDYYSTAAQAIIGDREEIGEILDKSFTTNAGGLYFSDEYMEGYKKSDIAINLVQETQRLRSGRKTDSVTIYLFSRDSEMLDIVREYYPHARSESYEPIERLTGKLTAIDHIVEYFANMQSGDKVKRSTIYKDLGIHRNTFGDSEKEPKFQEAMGKHGITKEKTSYIKA